MLSPTSPETSSRETPDPREPTSPGLTLSDTGRPLASPEPGSGGDSTLTSRVPLLSPASGLGDRGSGSSTFSVRRVTSSLTTGSPGATERAEPSSAVPLPMTPRNTTASSTRVPSPTSALARPSPSGAGTAGRVLALSTSPEAPDTPSTPKARTLASERSGGPTALSITSVSRMKPSLSPSPSLASEDTHADSAGPEFPAASRSSQTPAFTSAAGRSQTRTSVVNYPTALRNSAWPDTSPKLETESPWAPSAVPATATPPAAAGVVPTSSSLNTGSVEGMSPRAPSTATLTTHSTRGPAAVRAPASSRVQPARGGGGDRRNNSLTSGAQLYEKSLAQPSSLISFCSCCQSLSDHHHSWKAKRPLVRIISDHKESRATILFFSL
uniref:mucin-16-like n=1 Tax=Halichoerus grypus TaxID=9711 RepID=UPI0016590B81|nr:mucin-16-like [Halichoerus grypus]